jgi:hypothetical protein
LALRRWEEFAENNTFCRAAAMGIFAIRQLAQPKAQQQRSGPAQGKVVAFRLLEDKLQVARIEFGSDACSASTSEQHCTTGAAGENFDGFEKLMNENSRAV